MNNIKFGNIIISDIFLGQSNILSVYAGNALVFEKEKVPENTGDNPVEEWRFNGNSGVVWAVAADSSNVYGAFSNGKVKKISSKCQEVWQFSGHSGNVTAITVDSSGNVYSAGDDKTVRKLSSSGEEVWKYTGHTSNVWGITVNDNCVHSCGGNELLTKISLDGREIWKKKIDGSLESVWTVDTDKLGNVYIGDDLRRIEKLSSDNGNSLWEKQPHTDFVRSISIDSMDNIYSCSDDKTVVKTAPHKSTIWKLIAHSNWVNSVAVDSKDNVYSGSFDNTVKKISSYGKEIWRFTGHTDKVRCVAVDDNNNVYSCGFDGTIRKINQV